MKKILSIIFSVLFTLCLALSFAGCNISFYCDPRGKEWYNAAGFPSISNPFQEIYDGSYSIQIDESGNVTLTTLEGETVNGTLSTSLERGSLLTSIQFEDGGTRTAICKQDKYGRYLRFSYKNQDYSFYGERCVSQEEMVAYRGQLIQFLTNVYQTGVFPTTAEIKNNILYERFTNAYQIDPGCGGPYVYKKVEQATIEKVEVVEDSQAKKLTIKANDRSVICVVGNDISVTMIRDGAFEKLAFSDIKEGKCLVIPYQFYSNGVIEEDILGIFYFE